MKKYVVFAGVNGAGKSTLYNLKKEFQDMNRVNTDEIVREFGSWNNPDDVLKAGKIAVKKISDFLREGVSFNQETTLCGNSIIRNIKKAKKLGYYIEIHYVGINSSEIAKVRIANRVRLGGHGIPDKDVERRYNESLEKLKIVLNLADYLGLYDNTNSFTAFAVYKNGVLKYVNETQKPEWYKRTFE